jgi:carboxyl-terminal processing protease
MRKIILLSVFLASCGGGGGGSGGSSAPIAKPSSWVQGVFKPASTFAAQCAAPRTGTDPATGKAYPDRQGSVTAENNWLRSWNNDWYLWYGEVFDHDPGTYSTSAAYFDVLKTTQLSPSGNPKDRFHFTYPTDKWIALSQSGIDAGYGVHWLFVQTAPPRKLLVAYVESPSPAATAGLDRGAEVLFIDGVDLVNAGDQASVNTLNAGLSPAALGESHQFVVRDLGASTTRTITLTSQNITNASVMNVKVLNTATGPVGYLQFNDHLASAEAGLVNAITTLKAANITDLVLDIRYNGGGYLDIANEAAYMIAGSTPTAGQVFEKTVFNDKYPNTNPVTGATLTPDMFLTTTQGFGSLPGNQALPTLNLSRVFVITGEDTCSASESIISGLRGVGVEVIQIGNTTCGKPYGFYPADNCGTTYFSIQFKGENAKGFGDYSDGFSPGAPAGTTTGAQLPGCTVADDVTHPMGSELESRLATALAYRTAPSCPAVALGGLGKLSAGANPLNAVQGKLVRPAVLENRLLRR